MQLDTQTCELPVGWRDDQGVVHRHALIRALTGAEEELFTASGLAPVQQVNRLLANCIVRLGPLTKLDDSQTARLSLVDRQVLLLHLRQLTFGDQVQAVLACPHCGAKVDIEFALSSIPVPQDPIPPVQNKTLPLPSLPAFQGEHEWEIEFRLPNGEDQDCLAQWIRENETEASHRLISRCVYKLGRFEQPSLDDIRRLPAGTRSLIENAMAQAAPNMDLDMDVQCPECGQGFVSPFDIQDFFLNEIRFSQATLLREVHYLAYHYHWSESEIMNMTRGKRRRYIGILSGEIERMNESYA